MAKKYFFNRARVILFLFFFGFVLFALGASFTLRGINSTGAVNLLLMVVGALCIVVAAYLIKKRWY
jgi:hypothetical protein